MGLRNTSPFPLNTDAEVHSVVAPLKVFVHVDHASRACASSSACAARAPIVAHAARLPLGHLAGPSGHRVVQDVGRIFANAILVAFHHLQEAPLSI